MKVFIWQWIGEKKYFGCKLVSLMNTSLRFRKSNFLFQDHPKIRVSKRIHRFFHSSLNKRSRRGIGIMVLLLKWRNNKSRKRISTSDANKLCLPARDVEREISSFTSNWTLSRYFNVSTTMIIFVISSKGFPIFIII